MLFPFSGSGRREGTGALEWREGVGDGGFFYGRIVISALYTFVSFLIPNCSSINLFQCDRGCEVVASKRLSGPQKSHFVDVFPFLN